jgi:hypothetical protein
MLRQDAYRFGRAVSDLWLLEEICDKAASQTLDADQVADTREQVRAGLRKACDLCAEAGLDARLGPQIARFDAAIGTETFTRLAGRIDELRERILDELDEQSYFPVPRQDKHFYGQAEPFGNDVATQFANSADEFREAAKCLSLQQSTACVFHLMRGMETAVKQIAGVLGMTITPGTTWRNLTGNMDARIQTMPTSTDLEKARKTSWEGARVNLHHLGSAIRNGTMHPDVSHTQEEARHIFSVTGVIMQALCRL